jgi:hypothetical protein
MSNPKGMEKTIHLHNFGQNHLFTQLNFMCMWKVVDIHVFGQNNAKKIQCWKSAI